MALEIRPARPDDLPNLERRCWRGGEAEMAARIAAQGTCSIIALDGGRPVAQLYLRTYQPGFRSPGGAHDGAWWADLAGVEPETTLPSRTAMLGCWHVGRVREADGTEREAEAYRGRGLGIALLQAAVTWLQQPDTPFDALAAKAADSEDRGYLGWLGGLPLPLFVAEGFRPLTSFDDPYFLPRPANLPAHVNVPHPARFHLVLRQR